MDAVTAVDYAAPPPDGWPAAHRAQSVQAHHGDVTATARTDAAHGYVRGYRGTWQVRVTDPDDDVLHLGTVDGNAFDALLHVTHEAASWSRLVEWRARLAAFAVAVEHYSDQAAPVAAAAAAWRRAGYPGTIVDRLADAHRERTLRSASQQAAAQRRRAAR